MSNNFINKLTHTSDYSLKNHPTNQPMLFLYRINPRHHDNERQRVARIQKRHAVA